MRTKIVPASKLSTRSLCAKDYIFTPVRVTISETMETEYIVHLEVETSDQAQSQIEELSEAGLKKLLKEGRRGETRLADRWVTAAVVVD